MKSLDWPYPSVLAGSLRTAMGKMSGSGSFDSGTVKALKDVSVHGPLPEISGSLFYPAPKDILVKDSGGKCDETYAIRPASPRTDGEGCDLPCQGLLPPMLSYRAEEEFKPAAIASFWSADIMASWLVNSDGLRFEAPKTPTHGDSKLVGLDQPKKESRFHTKINPGRGVAEEKHLFETIGLDLNLKDRPEGITLSARIESDETNPFREIVFGAFTAFGGERRLSYVRTNTKDPHGWRCPKKVEDALKNASLVRMILATPAIFKKGWLPGWIDESTLTGTPACIPDNKPDKPILKLVSACVDRWKPLSGFCLEYGKTRPKHLRRVVPAGSVYFFTVESGTSADLIPYWLRPVSDESQDRNDGFGLALWGIWGYEQKEDLSKSNLKA
jgi:CRISPR-associated protein Cmr3